MPTQNIFFRVKGSLVNLTGCSGHVLTEKEGITSYEKGKLV